MARYIAGLLWVVIFIPPLLADTGEDIYQRGITQSGTAIIGNQNSQAPSHLFPCANCHGERAAGSKESGISAPNITWSQLTQPYRKDLDGGKPRSAYTTKSFRQLLLSGINSDGESLTGSMPRYDLTDSEITSLIEHLQHISEQSERGVEPDTIHFWLRLPDDPSLAAAMSNTVNAFVNNLNQQGGIYRRQINLHDFSAQQAANSAFAIIDLRMLEQQQSISDHISLGIFESDNAGDNAYFLYLHPADFEQLQQSIAHQRGWTVIDTVSDVPEQALNHLLQTSADNDRYTVLIQHSQTLPIEQLLHSLDQQQRYPGILTDMPPLSDAQRLSIQNYPAPVYLLTPPGTESVSTAGRVRFAKMAAQKGLSANHLSARLWSLSLMQLLVITLEQSGKQLTEQVFMTTLQSHVDLQTDFGPTLSYSASRRVGNNDAILIQLN